MEQDDKRREPGCGLGLLLVMIGLLAPALWIYRLVKGLQSSPEFAALLGDRWPALLVAEWTITVSCILGLWFVCLRLLYVHRWSSVRIAVAGLWIVNLGGFLVEAAVLLAMSGAAVDGFMRNGGAIQLARPLLFNLAWTVYLLKSASVAAAYRRDGDGDGEAGLFE